MAYHLVDKRLTTYDLRLTTNDLPLTLMPNN